MEKSIHVTFSGFYSEPLDVFLKGIVLVDRSVLYVTHDGKKYVWMHSVIDPDSGSRVQKYVKFWEPRHNYLSLYELCQDFHCCTPLTKHDLECSVIQSYKNNHKEDIEFYAGAYETLYGREALESLISSLQ